LFRVLYSQLNRMPAFLRSLAADLAAGRTTSRRLVEQCLARIAAPDGEGSRVFLKVDAERALALADHHDAERRNGRAVSPFAGIPISIKDLFDRKGEVTLAGSTLLRNAPPATEDATAVARLIAAGFVPIGRTNMTEFAFSGLGLNCHYGTPANPFDRATGRIPGGSSSGAAVSITDGMAFAALGTDTGGSCRIPAAMCGIVGFKPTARRVPLTGAFPLSPSLDSIGPLASSVECCAIVDAILAGESVEPLKARPLQGVRFAVPQSFVFGEIEPAVASAFQRAVSALSAQGADVVDLPLKPFLELPDINRKGGLAPPEAYAIHREWVAWQADAYDPRVLTRILRGKEQDAADYIQLRQARERFIARVTEELQGFDTMLMPTVPIVAPPIDSLGDDDAYTRTNMLALRNPSIVNFLDGCAISIPCHTPGEAPVGLMIAALGGRDRDLLAIAKSAEAVLDQALKRPAPSSAS
jgi:aspartyl-tRNA(Asn)/glutamyl-tRNA(Gln) amidotransferase subunit A